MKEARSMNTANWLQAVTFISFCPSIMPTVSSSLNVASLKKMLLTTEVSNLEINPETQLYGISFLEERYLTVIVVMSAIRAITKESR